METAIEQRLDAILEGEVAKGFRIKDVPADVRALVREAGLPDTPRVRFTRLNPKKRRTASEIVQRQYQRDLKNRDILSNAEVAKLNAERGEWGAEQDERLKVVQAKVSTLMKSLYADGVADGLAQWGDEILRHAGEVRDAIEQAREAGALGAAEHQAVLATFNRWMEFTPERRDEYTGRYAAEQGRAVYSHDADLGAVVDVLAGVSIEAMNAMLALQDRMEKVHRFTELGDLRAEQAQLNVTRARIFSDTVESRRDHNEELARLFVSCERVTEPGDDAKPAGPVARTFDDVFEFPDEAIQWLLQESFLFHANLPDEYRDYLSTYGFVRAERATTTAAGEATTGAPTGAPTTPSATPPSATDSAPAGSAGSPAPPSSNPA